MSTSTNKTAVVTGASAGIGAVYADRIAARGYNLILVARRADRLAQLADDIRAKHGVAVETIVADLMNEADLGKVEKIIANNPAISVLVNNAGNAKLAPMSATSTSDAAAMIALNVTALTRLTQAILPALRQNGAGAIVNVASALSIHTLPVSAVYSGTKGYVMNFTRGLQTELADTGVRVQLVMPATTATELWDIAGIPLDQHNPDAIMTAEAMVDAALAGFDMGETITMPSVHDAGLWDSYDAARLALFNSTKTGQPAPRYITA